MSYRLGPLSSLGPLGGSGALPDRYIGSVNSSKTASYSNNWCNVQSTDDDSLCVYGSYGPIGTSGPLNSNAYYYTMYHLEQGVFWHQEYNMNLDICGVWGIQGPVGPTGALGVLGALGPLGISLQAGVTTTANGVYMVDNKVIRQTQPVRYTHNASEYRVYELVEMYSRSYALQLGSKGQDTNDCSFAVDSSGVNPTVGSSDTYKFTSYANQFVSILIVPVDNGNVYSLELQCASSGSAYHSIATAASNPHSSSLGLVNFIVSRVNAGENCQVMVKQMVSGTDSDAGYYLYVTGTNVLSVDQNGKVNKNTDYWGPRLQNDGSLAYNINGNHQLWVKS